MINRATVILCRNLWALRSWLSASRPLADIGEVGGLIALPSDTMCSRKDGRRKAASSLSSLYVDLRFKRCAIALARPLYIIMIASITRVTTLHGRRAVCMDIDVHVVKWSEAQRLTRSIDTRGWYTWAYNIFSRQHFGPMHVSSLTLSLMRFALGKSTKWSSIFEEKFSEQAYSCCIQHAYTARVAPSHRSIYEETQVQFTQIKFCQFFVMFKLDLYVDGHKQLLNNPGSNYI